VHDATLLQRWEALHTRRRGCYACDAPPGMGHGGGVSWQGRCIEGCVYQGDSQSDSQGGDPPVGQARRGMAGEVERDRLASEHRARAGGGTTGRGGRAAAGRGEAGRDRVGWGCSSAGGSLGRGGGGWVEASGSGVERAEAILEGEVDRVGTIPEGELDRAAVISDGGMEGELESSVAGVTETAIRMRRGELGGASGAQGDTSRDVTRVTSPAERDGSMDKSPAGRDTSRDKCLDANDASLTADEYGDASVAAERTSLDTSPAARDTSSAAREEGDASSAEGTPSGPKLEALCEAAAASSQEGGGGAPVLQRAAPSICPVLAAACSVPSGGGDTPNTPKRRPSAVGPRAVVSRGSSAGDMWV
jgi:hypothetical protein